MGLGYSPLLLFTPDEFQLSTWDKLKKNIQLEVVSGPKLTFNFNFQNESYNYKINPEILYATPDNPYNDEGNLRIQSKAIINTLSLDFRKYSYKAGYLAPYGRFMLYGFSICNGKFTTDSFSFTARDFQNDKITYSFAKDQFSTIDFGLRMGMGKKKYISKRQSDYLEYQMLFEFKFGSFKEGLTYDGFYRSAGIRHLNYDVGMRLSQITSLFQFNLIYGFSL